MKRENEKMTNGDDDDEKSIALVNIATNVISIPWLGINV